MRQWSGTRTVVPPANPDHVEVISGPPAEWNKWRAANPNAVLELYGADLSGQDLSGRDLRGARLDGANLTDAKLQRAKLDRASFKEATLYRANLDECKAIGANLRRADLLMAHVSGAVLPRVDLGGARLAGATIHRSQLSGSNLSDTDLREAEFVGSDMRRVDLAGSYLWTTDLSDVDLRYATGMRFDETLIRNTKFAPRAGDRWSTLRRHYTGPRYVLTLLLLVAFVVPYVVKAAGWVAASHTQSSMVDAVASAEARLARLDSSDASTVVAEVLSGIREDLPVAGNSEWRSARVWQLLLGLDKGLWFFLSTSALLAYNVLRGVLTWVVAPMRDAEERSGVAPPHRVEGDNVPQRVRNWLKGGWAETYAWLWVPHRTVTILSVVAAGTFLFHAYTWLALEVWLPN